MCWSNDIAIPIVLKKPLRVYKVGISTMLGNFISLYQNFMYCRHKVMPTIKIIPEFTRKYNTKRLFLDIPGYDIFCICEGYHSYLTEEMAKYKRNICDDIGIFEIPAGATIYVNYRYQEVVSTDIKYLGPLEV